MKREKKYRAISLDTFEWECGYLVMSPDKELANICNQKGCNLIQMNAVNPETICEYTGLKDKNGKEIYEWDIVEFLWKPLEDMDGKLEKVQCQIVWSKQGAWCLKWKDGYENGARLTPEKYTVIGNIHENKDLLK